MKEKMITMISSGILSKLFEISNFSIRPEPETSSLSKYNKSYMLHRAQPITNYSIAIFLDKSSSRFIKLSTLLHFYVPILNTEATFYHKMYLLGDTNPLKKSPFSLF